ncbi:MAG: hypothetical protein HAW63_00250 [Bdellovibrionaceae bacterium]|nr:hypothetical protein [Pseudobdellovibrionaceae bacterium]
MKNSLTVVCLLLSSCIFQKQNLSYYQKNFEKLKYTEQANNIAKKILFLLKEKELFYSKATPYLLYLAKHAESTDEQAAYQEKLASIYFKKPAQVNKAIQIWFNLIATAKENKKNQYKILIAKGYFKNKKYKQALLELRNMKGLNKKMSLSAQLLKIKIFLELRQWHKVIDLYKAVKINFYLEYKKQELALGLIAAYKQLSLHQLILQELQELKAYHAFPRFVERRISIVKKRIKNQPKLRR